jgi:hypothetical protein
MAAYDGERLHYSWMMMMQQQQQQHHHQVFRFITEKWLQVFVHLIVPTVATNTTPNSTVRYFIPVTYSDVSAQRELQHKSGTRQHTPRSEHLSCLSPQIRQ